MPDPLWLAEIRRCLWPRGADRNAWAILDGAQDREVYWSLINSYLEYSCLYAGNLAPELQMAAPHLVQLEYDDQYTDALLRKGWGKSWGVFLRCDAGMNSLRRHLRTFLLVRGPAGQRLVFRYYDPRVLRVYLPTCFAAELQAVFGPIESFVVEAEDPGEAHQFAFERGKLLNRVLSLESAPSPAG
jgi:hypothetical protein